ncbi:MAG: mitochondrial splicing system protein [Cirrosporium novae-zelandiae]|nr:MAG: mitochondrial splicing system protein [Cirrosporium novae-zelandiae]
MTSLIRRAIGISSYGIPLRIIDTSRSRILAPGSYLQLQLVPSRVRTLGSFSPSRGNAVNSSRNSNPGALNNWSNNTIYALSTAPGRAAIAVIRISGLACTAVTDELPQIYDALCPSHPLPHPRHASLRTLYTPGLPPSRDSILDPGSLVLFFPAPQTVTGEDVLELHIHGGPAIVKAVLAAIPTVSTLIAQQHEEISTHSIRYAEAGEFTRRAFLNDRMDLPQIEALGETLAAETEQQRKLSIRGANSALATRYEQWRQQLLHARGELEALIDFSEDQNFEESGQELLKSVRTQLVLLLEQLRLHVKNSERGELLRHGVSIALLGAPNAGKSSLLNQIVGREAAIVSIEEGTTRDIVDVNVDIGGFYCRLGDMAGLRTDVSAPAAPAVQAANPTGNRNAKIGIVEKEGIKRAKQRALESDLIIAVLSIEPADHQTNNSNSNSNSDPDPGDSDCDGRDGYVVRPEPEVLAAALACIKAGKRVLWVVNKIDRLVIVGDQERTREKAEGEARRQALGILREYGIVEALTGLEEEGGKEREREEENPTKSHKTMPILTISCKEAAQTSSTPTPSQPSQPSQPQPHDPGNLHKLLTLIIKTLTSISSPISTSFTTPTPTPPTTINFHYYQESLNVTYRQRQNLELCIGYLEDYLHLMMGDGEVEGVEGTAGVNVDIAAAAENLRFAARCLGRINGRVGGGGDIGEGGDVEEVLGVVFEK